VYIFSTYDLVSSKIRSLDAEKAVKLVETYQLCRAEEDNNKNLLKPFDLLFFQVLQISLPLFDLKNTTVNCTCANVLLILFFAL